MPEFRITPKIRGVLALESKILGAEDYCLVSTLGIECPKPRQGLPGMSIEYMGTGQPSSLNCSALKIVDAARGD